MSYANNKGADQPAHPRSLISAFVVRCLNSVMSLVLVTQISSLMLASVAEQASFNLTWSETPKDMFSHDEAHMYIAPGQGQTTPLGQTFDVNRKPLSLCLFVAGLKQIALKSDFIYIFFMFHHMYIAPGRGRQSIGDKLLMTTERPFLFAHMLQVSKWSLRNLILYTFLMILYMYSPGTRAENPLRTNVWGRQKALIILTICCKFQTNLWILILYTFLNVCPHEYSPWAGADNPLWQSVNRKSLSLCPFVASFKKI